MEINQLTELLKTEAPAHLKEICTTLRDLSNKMEYVKYALSNNLLAAQNQDDFSKAHKIIDAQEELTMRIDKIQQYLEYADIEETESETTKDVQQKSSVLGDRIDYSQYNTDDTVAFPLADASVTFKKPAAFTFERKRYAVTNWKEMLVKLCNILYSKNPQIIREMMNEKRQLGKVGVKMSTNKENIHSPVRIADSNIWIETNRSAADIQKKMLAILEIYELPLDSVLFFFRRDYTVLHETRE
jgi:hypothetical protein